MPSSLFFLDVYSCKRFQSYISNLIARLGFYHRDWRAYCSYL